MSGDSPHIPADERICVIIPAYKVASNIQTVIRGVPPWVADIVVVDDASPDETATRVLALRDPRVILVRHRHNQGVGGAMLTGYGTALQRGATVLVKMDGDDQMSPSHLYPLVRPILEGRADYSKGNRFVDMRAITRMPLLRRLGNVGLSFLTKVASGYWNIFDPTNGYTAIDADVFRSIERTRIHRRYFFESSMLIQLNVLQATIADVPIPARYAGETSSMSLMRVLIEFPVLLHRLFLRRIWLQYFVLDFSVASLFMMAGLLLTLFGTVWGSVAWSISIRTAIPASTGTVMIAVLPLILGFQLLLQAVVFDVQKVPRIPRSQRAGERSARHITQTLPQREAASLRQ